MSDLEAIADRVEIEALRGEFTDAAMMRDYDRLASLFTPAGRDQVCGARKAVTMASPLSPGTWDPGPVHPGVRFGVSVAVGGFASGPVTASPSRLLAAGQVVVSDPASPPIPGTADPPPDARRLASTHLRIARPSRDLAKAEAFWAGGLGLTTPGRSAPPAGAQEPPG